MPTPISSSSPACTASKPLAPKSRIQHSKKKRIIRRRGRAPGDLASDDEIEREAATDSDSEDDLSSFASDSDSDAELVEDVVPNGHSRALTPNTSQSSGELNGPEKAADQAESFFAAGGNWSEMVADDEKGTEPADLPVIEFADFDGQNLPARSRPKKSKKVAKNVRLAPETSTPPPQVNGDRSSDEAEDHQHIASTSRSHQSEPPRRILGQTARQAYQQRLESDPSYVPTVGGFWGHDDRLLDKKLRPLSGWWRDRGGGRGRGNGLHGRGRGAFSGANGHGDDANAVELPPIEQTWGHDGFEEMKQREEQRKAAQNAQAPTQSFRGGRGFVAARGGRGSFGRGGFANTSGRSSANSGRIWYSRKPEFSWTKQHEGYLYHELDPSLRPRQGQGPGIIVKLPGKEAKVIRSSFRPQPAAKPRVADEEEEKIYAVNLPKIFTKGVKVVIAPQETSLEEVFKVRPSLAPKNITPIPAQQSAPPVEAAPIPSPPEAQGVRQTPSHQPIPPTATSSNSEPGTSVRLQLERLSVDLDPSDPVRVAKTEEAVLRNPLAELTAEQPVPTHEEPIPTMPAMYSPPLPQPSPSFGSPFGYPPALPPGIAMNQHGVPYELATGRPVYLQAPPPPMYNPRPIVHSHLPPAFVPSHMHSHSHSHSLSAVSPDFLAQSTSHTPPMNGFIDPSTGTPIFSFPRQTSRIEIRAPIEGSEVKSPKTSSHLSGLRTSAPSFEPSRPSSDNLANGYYPTLSSPEHGTLPSYVPVEGAEGSLDGMQHDPAMMAYAPYPQPQYYYPDAYAYTHNPYMDMSHMQPYEMYPPHEGGVYY